MGCAVVLRDVFGIFVFELANQRRGLAHGELVQFRAEVLARGFNGIASQAPADRGDRAVLTGRGGPGALTLFTSADARDLMVQRLFDLDVDFSDACLQPLGLIQQGAVQLG